LERIFQQHLLQGRPVDELVVQPPLSRPILKNAKHSRVKSYFRNKK
jgi:hypothetical protein